MKKIKKFKFILLFLIVVITFFTARLTVTWDSAHYLSYVEIFERVRSFSSWDIVRGPVFPLFIFVGNTLFGKNAIGMLSMIFIVFLIYSYLVYLVSCILFKKYKHGKFFSSLFVIFSAFNPIIFGYFHTLLTEVLAIMLMMLSCYISYKWLYVKGKNQKIIYSVFYVLLLLFCYFLKQPYICIAFVPMLLSGVISIVQCHNKINILYRIGTFFASFIILILSIVCWNRFLILKNVDMNTGRDTSSLLTEQLLRSISNFEISFVDDYSVVENDMTLSKSERSIAKKVFASDKKIMLIKIYDGVNLIESDLIPVSDDSVNVIDVVKEISFFSIKHPNLLVEAYSKNYCAISGVCVIDTADGIVYWVTNKYDLVNLFENNSIAYKFLNSGSNLFYLSPEKYQSAKVYEQNYGLSITSRMISLLKSPTNIIYEIVMIIMPLVIVFNIVVRFVKRKNFVKGETYYLGIIFLLSSFFTLVFSSVSGQIIDRYSVYCFIPGLIGIVACIMCVFSNIKFKKGKE